MRVLVSVKAVSDPAQRLRVRADGMGVDLDGIRTILNPFDEVALEQALRWRESGAVTEVVVAGVGADRAKVALRMALALGADRAIHVRAPDTLALLAVAKALRDVVRSEGCGMAMLGMQASEDGEAERGPMLAALLDWPEATGAIATTLTGTAVQIDRVARDGVETMEIDLPCVFTADLPLATPRFANIAAVLRAKNAPIEERSAAFVAPAATILSMQEVPPRRAGQRVASVRELLAALRARGSLV